MKHSQNMPPLKRRWFLTKINKKISSVLKLILPVLILLSLLFASYAHTVKVKIWRGDDYKESLASYGDVAQGSALKSVSRDKLGICKYEGQYSAQGYGLETAQSGIINAHYVNWDEDTDYCSTTDCGGGVWSPDAPGAYDLYPTSPEVITGSYAPGSCCGDDEDDDPDMGNEACYKYDADSGESTSCLDGSNQGYRRWSGDVNDLNPNLYDTGYGIGCCGDDMTDDCMLFSPRPNTQYYLCFGVGGERVVYEQEGTTPSQNCECPSQGCYLPDHPECCPRFMCGGGGTGQGPSNMGQMPPFNTSRSSWDWKSIGGIEGYIFNVTCAGYPVLAATNFWVSCSDYLVNRDARQVPLVEHYFSLDGLADESEEVENPTTVDNHEYLCYHEGNRSFTIAECCGNERTD